MTLPYHVFCDLPAPRVFELVDGRFQLIDPGPISPFLAGHRYLLVERPLAELLAGLDVGHVGYEDAILFNPGTGEEHRTHVRLRVGQLFRADQLPGLAIDGMRLLTLEDEYYFVSPDLKAALEAGSFGYLQFSEGLSAFAGSAGQAAHVNR